MRVHTSVVDLQLNKSKLVSLSQFYHTTIIRSEKLKPETVTSFVVFLLLIKSDNRYQIRRQVSPDTHHLILYHDVFHQMSAQKN